ncbi:MAG: transporter [Actinomycetota bacterium]
MSRIALTAGVLAVWLLGVWGMWRGWRARVARTAIADLPVAPEVPGADLVQPLIGLYLGTTAADGWLDRVAAGRLGERSSGWLRVVPTGVLIRRPSYDDLFIPAGTLESVRTDKGHAGRVVGADGVVIVGWRHGGRRLDTGFRGDDRGGHAPVCAAISGLVPAQSRQPAKESQ